MPSRQIIAKELTEVFKVIAHADRIRLIEELHRGEMDVNTLAETLNLPARECRNISAYFEHIESSKKDVMDATICTS